MSEKRVTILRGQHKPPTAAKMVRVARMCRELLEQEPDSESAGYRRGIAEALTWAVGRNEYFEREVARCIAKKGKSA